MHCPHNRKKTMRAIIGIVLFSLVMLSAVCAGVSVGEAAHAVTAAANAKPSNYSNDDATAIYGKKRQTSGGCTYKHVTFYENIDFNNNKLGMSFTTDNTATVISNPNVGSTWNDRASSLQMDPGLYLEMWQDANYSGTLVTVTCAVTSYYGCSVADLGASYNFNDKMTSYRITIIDQNYNNICFTP